MYEPASNDEITGLVKYIDQHDEIMRPVGKRQNTAVELTHWNRGVWSRANLHSRDAELGAELHNRPREGAVSTTHVEHSSDPVRDHRRDIVGERVNAPPEDQSAVQSGRDGGKHSARHGNGSTARDEVFG